MKRSTHEICWTAIGRTFRPIRVPCAVHATLAALALAGCGGHATNDTESASAQEPIAECQEYQRVFAACMHRDLDVITTTTAMAKSPADRARVAEMCATNLTRIRQACR